MSQMFLSWLLVIMFPKYMLIIWFFEHRNHTFENLILCRNMTMDVEDDCDLSAANKDLPTPTPKGFTLMDEIKGLKLMVYEVANKQNTVEKVYLFFLKYATISAMLLGIKYFYCITENYG